MARDFSFALKMTIKRIVTQPLRGNDIFSDSLKSKEVLFDIVKKL